MHVGTQNVSQQMSHYVYRRNRDGIHYLDLAKTWEKIMVAARIVAAVQAKNKNDVLVSTQPPIVPPECVLCDTPTLRVLSFLNDY